ncbi:hypothetical protein DPMN_036604 [Dreissena polymorpha]|uniref:Uncharacterized protein n=1 Tax=Dreissena polymorpha TaxID=45954 RepID=A0A9D4MBU0_DREPO|nr:hypothetical protein DPMN_036604 [Dreissena polymorpha]
MFTVDVIHCSLQYKKKFCPSIVFPWLTLGMFFSRWQILDMAKNMVCALGIENEPTKHWFYGFLK